MDYKTITLANGLRVVHNCEPARAMVAINLLYNVGSRDESPELTGIAHLFEHLMFGGSANIPDYTRAIESAGGNDNAWTSNDFTNFYVQVPAHNVETAFWAESDRMLALSFDPHVLEVQQRVVIEEFKQQCLNQPYGDLMHHLRKAAYGGGHPYSWPVIGLEPEHIAKVTEKDVRDWFYTHYAPNNAVLAVCGNISFERTVELAEKWFGPIPARAIAPRSLPAPAFPKEEVRLTAHGNVPSTLIVKAIPMDAHGTPDYYAADTITDLLANGESSRYIRRLIHGPETIFSGANASIIGSEHEGLMLLMAQMADESEEAVNRAEELLMQEARALAVPGEVSEYELERSFNRFEFTFETSMTNYLDKAQELAISVMHDEDINRRVAVQRSTTLGDIRRVADRLFNHTPAVTLFYRPEK
ncbi:MAG: insulinase family protein [Muribaculaceae bacterium]|nr:insulinase family protein [Muribaculaceae bacterium]